MNIFDKKQNLDSPATLRTARELYDFDQMLKCRPGSIMKMSCFNHDYNGDPDDYGPEYRDNFFIFLGVRRRVIDDNLTIRVYGGLWKRGIRDIFDGARSLRSIKKLDFESVRGNYSQRETWETNTDRVWLMTDKPAGVKLKMKDFK